jgi:glutamyl-Q tRNA(Asp) synthetase
VNAHGEKLSKQTRAQPVHREQANYAIYAALRFLGQAPPDTLAGANVPELWTWAIAHWDLERVPRTRSAASIGS